MREGTLVDATILAAPASTQNRAKSRDPKMHQTYRGKQWYFGMKVHIGANADSGLVHTLVGTAANTSDVSQVEHLLHGEEKADIHELHQLLEQALPERRSMNGYRVGHDFPHLGGRTMNLCARAIGNA